MLPFRGVRIDVVPEQIGLVALQFQDGGIPALFIFCQVPHRHRPQGMVPQGYMENVILICFLAFMFVAFLIRPGHSPVADLYFLTGGKGILLVEQGLQFRLYLGRGERIEFCGQVGNQFVGVMAYSVHIVPVFVIAWKFAFNIGHPAFQLLLQRDIIVLHLQNVRIF